MRFEHIVRLRNEHLDDGKPSAEIAIWCEENVGPYQDRYWNDDHEPKNGEPVWGFFWNGEGHFLDFKLVRDAIHFKLRWY